MKACANKPCASCPWRKSNTPSNNQIPNFSLELMRKLKSTVAPEGSDKDGFFNIMACHASKEGMEFTCAGYAISEGLNNINFRLQASMYKINMEKLSKSVKPGELYSSFYTMLNDYENEHKKTSQP